MLESSYDLPHAVFIICLLLRLQVMKELAIAMQDSTENLPEANRAPEGTVAGGEGVKKLGYQLSVFRRDKLL